MFRRTMVAPVAALLTVALCAVLPATSSSASAYQTVAQEEALAAPTTSYADTELVELLASAGLLEAWTDAATVAAEVALVAVVGSPQYDELRAELVGDLKRLVERRDHLSRRSATIDGLAEDVAVLERLSRDLRRMVTAGSRTVALSLTDDEVEQARLSLATVVGDQHWMGISLDPVALAEHRLVTIRDQLQREVAELAGDRSSSAKTSAATIARLTDLQGDLHRVRNLLADARQVMVPSHIEYALDRSAVVDGMASLHERRLLLTTEVGGLPVVTLDAYVRGASELDAACPVDWNLLAGIGRVESFHGTIGGSQVQQSGLVTVPIFGPLLDGGATEREAAAAAAEAEEAALRELEELAALEDDETPQPRYDPLLWGDVPLEDDPTEAVEPPVDDDEDDEADADEEPVSRGNGFAVIHDSDNGRLDGNARWDRAVGPMQFLPETWSYWETDGDGDGVADPQNLYDAAATAGQFLCHLSRTRGASPYTFVLGYNASDTYVRNVMAVADAFGAVELPGPSSLRGAADQ